MKRQSSATGWTWPWKRSGKRLGTRWERTTRILGIRGVFSWPMKCRSVVSPAPLSSIALSVEAVIVPDQPDYLSQANGPPVQFCHRCGTGHEPDWKFCRNCGHDLSDTSAPAVETTTTGPSSPFMSSAPPPVAPPVPPAYYYGPPVAERRSTNGFAIASMVLGIIWIYWIGSILALVFGYVAKKQIKESNGSEGGSGMATAGIVLGWIGVATLVAFIVILIVAAATSHPSNTGGYYGP
jgi:hypothetical protein